MSWRFLLASIMVSALMAALVGYVAGVWLANHSPKTANLPNVSANDPPPALDVYGRPILREPMQLLFDGSIGMIDREEPTPDWKVYPHQLATVEKVQIDPALLVDIVAGAPRQAFSQELTQGEVGESTKSTTRIASQTKATSQVQFEWEVPFRVAMAQCRTQTLSARRQCIRQVREQFCAPNQAWGQVDDCPAR